jgi:NAD(P)-dependent dehydrogenase (short-subunit alcohol dehydrogenase family)
MSAAGAKVVLADLPGTGVEEAAAAVGGDAAHHDVDISDEASVAALIEFTLDTFGRLDVLDNNAARGGSPEDALVEKMSVDLWDATFAVNARGTMLMCKHALPRMVEGGGGSIVNVTSGTSLGGADFATAYACTKAAVTTLTLYVATQYGRHGIRCNAVGPGVTRTPLLEASLPQEVIDVFSSHGLLGRIGDPHEIAELVCFLSSDRASYITGQLMLADGGIRSQTPTVPALRALAAREG